MKKKQSSKPIFAAIPLAVPTRGDEELLKVPLLAKKSNKKTSSSHITMTQKSWNFVAGALLGMLLSIVGFQILLQYASTALTRWQIVLFSLAWSSSTYFIAYTLFTAIHGSCLETSIKVWERLEYFFAMGVFCGFCTACTATDVRYGLPLASILLTLCIALAWTILMLVVCCYQSSVMDQEEEDEEKERRGTVLPMVMV